MRTPTLIILTLAVSHASHLSADEEQTFRTDHSTDETRTWYQLVDGEFPPEGSAHYFSGELTKVDHLNRAFVLRIDRTDKQNRSHFDLPVAITMLPYGAIYYNGAPAALQDIPLGTHLHGLFYAKHPDDETKRLEGWYNRVSIEADFTRCVRIEDDFSFYARQNQHWRIDDYDREQNKLTATLMQQDHAVGEPAVFDVLDSTRVWQDNGIGTLKDIAAGQLVQFNITWATLYGAGRILELWIDDASRQLATSHQLERHRQHIRERGLPAMVNTVDNQQRLVTVTFFDSVDQSLFEELAIVNNEPLGWPIKHEPASTNTAKATLAVARHTLMTYDPVNDRKGRPVRELRRVPRAFGSAGVEATIECSVLLEGFRPNRIVRVYPSHWKVIALPKEEEFFGLDE